MVDLPLQDRQVLWMEVSRHTKECSMDSFVCDLKASNELKQTVMFPERASLDDENLIMADSTCTKLQCSVTFLRSSHCTLFLLHCM